MDDEYSCYSRRMIPKIELAIVGYGFVGKAVHAAFPTCKYLIDPILNTDLTDLPTELNYAFVCVPTPSLENGDIDDSIVLSVVRYLLEQTAAIVIIKSTVLPYIVEKLPSFLSHRVCFNPEFLTERHAVEDMLNAETVVIGGESQTVQEQVWQLYEKHSRCNVKSASFVSSAEACWVKYITNTMLAAKVALLNEYYKEVNNTYSWDRIIKVLHKDERLGTSHWLVPGPDNKFGFGGACFPKDLNALLHNAENLDILETVKKSNDRIRKHYELDEREQAQNIQYKN